MKKLKQIRLKNKFTYQSMADCLGISKVFYWQLENDKRRITYDMAYKIAQILQTKPDDLFYEDTKAKIQ